MRRQLAGTLLAFDLLSSAHAATDPMFDGSASGPTREAVVVGDLIQQEQRVAPGEPTRVDRSSAIDGPPAPRAPKAQASSGFLDGLAGLMKWDTRSLPAFGIGMGIGFGIVFFSGMLFANPLLAIAGGLFAGLIIGFMLNAFK